MNGVEMVEWFLAWRMARSYVEIWNEATNFCYISFNSFCNFSILKLQKRKKNPVVSVRCAVLCTMYCSDGWPRAPGKLPQHPTPLLSCRGACWQLTELSQRITGSMSWQVYVDEHLLTELPSGGSLSQGAIVGQDGAVWAQSAGFPEITDDEVAKIMEELNSPGKIAQSGLFLGGTKYIVIPGEPGEVIRGRKNQDGVTIKKTLTALVIGIYGEGVQAGDANTVVENLGDYLIEQKY